MRSIRSLKRPRGGPFFLSRGPHLAVEGAWRSVQGAGGMHGPLCGRRGEWKEDIRTRNGRPWGCRSRRGPVSTIFPLERSTPGRRGGAKGDKGGGWDAGTNAREAAGLRRRFGQGGGRLWAAGQICRYIRAFFLFFHCYTPSVLKQDRR